MSYENNLYYYPQMNGLETVGEFDWAEPDYSFDLCVVWKEKRGMYWVGNDSGCSCPAPFEDQTKDDLMGPYNKAQLKERLETMVDEQTKGEYSYGRSKAELMKDVREILSRIT